MTCCCPRVPGGRAGVAGGPCAPFEFILIAGEFQTLTETIFAYRVVCECVEPGGVDETLAWGVRAAKWGSVSPLGRRCPSLWRWDL